MSLDRHDTLSPDLRSIPVDIRADNPVTGSSHTDVGRMDALDSANRGREAIRGLDTSGVDAFLQQRGQALADLITANPDDPRIQSEFGLINRDAITAIKNDPSLAAYMINPSGGQAWGGRSYEHFQLHGGRVKNLFDQYNIQVDEAALMDPTRAYDVGAQLDQLELAIHQRYRGQTRGQMSREEMRIMRRMKARELGALNQYKRNRAGISSVQDRRTRELDSLSSDPALRMSPTEFASRGNSGGIIMALNRHGDDRAYQTAMSRQRQRIQDLNRDRDRSSSRGGRGGHGSGGISSREDRFNSEHGASMRARPMSSRISTSGYGQQFRMEKDSLERGRPMLGDLHTFLRYAGMTASSTYRDAATASVDRLFSGEDMNPFHKHALVGMALLAQEFNETGNQTALDKLRNRVESSGILSLTSGQISEIFSPDFIATAGPAGNARERMHQIHVETYGSEARRYLQGGAYQDYEALMNLADQEVAEGKIAATEVAEIRTEAPRLALNGIINRSRTIPGYTDGEPVSELDKNLDYMELDMLNEIVGYTKDDGTVVPGTLADVKAEAMGAAAGNAETVEFLSGLQTQLESVRDQRVAAVDHMKKFRAAFAARDAEELKRLTAALADPANELTRTLDDPDAPNAAEEAIYRMRVEARHASYDTRDEAAQFLGYLDGLQREVTKQRELGELITDARNLHTDFRSAPPTPDQTRADIKPEDITAIITAVNNGTIDPSDYVDGYVEANSAEYERQKDHYLLQLDSRRAALLFEQDRGELLDSLNTTSFLGSGRTAIADRLDTVHIETLEGLRREMRQRQSGEGMPDGRPDTRDYSVLTAVIDQAVARRKPVAEELVTFLVAHARGEEAPVTAAHTPERIDALLNEYARHPAVNNADAPAFLEHMQALRMQLEEAAKPANSIVNGVLRRQEHEGETREESRAVLSRVSDTKLEFVRQEVEERLGVEAAESYPGQEAVVERLTAFRNDVLRTQADRIEDRVAAAGHLPDSWEDHYTLFRNASESENRDSALAEIHAHQKRLADGIGRALSERVGELELTTDRYFSAEDEARITSSLDSLPMGVLGAMAQRIDETRNEPRVREQSLLVDVIDEHHMTRFRNHIASVHALELFDRRDRTAIDQLLAGKDIKEITGMYTELTNHPGQFSAEQDDTGRLSNYLRRKINEMSAASGTPTEETSFVDPAAQAVYRRLQRIAGNENISHEHSSDGNVDLFVLRGNWNSELLQNQLNGLLRTSGVPERNVAGNGFTVIDRGNAVAIHTGRIENLERVLGAGIETALTPGAVRGILSNAQVRLSEQQQRHLAVLQEIFGEENIRLENTGDGNNIPQFTLRGGTAAQCQALCDQLNQYVNDNISDSATGFATIDRGGPAVAITSQRMDTWGEINPAELIDDLTDRNRAVDIGAILKKDEFNAFRND